MCITNLNNETRNLQIHYYIEQYIYFVLDLINTYCNVVDLFKKNL